MVAGFFCSGKKTSINVKNGVVKKNTYYFIVKMERRSARNASRPSISYAAYYDDGKDEIEFRNNPDNFLPPSPSAAQTLNKRRIQFVPRHILTTPRPKPKSSVPVVAATPNPPTVPNTTVVSAAPDSSPCPFTMTVGVETLTDAQKIARAESKPRRSQQKPIPPGAPIFCICCIPSRVHTWYHVINEQRRWNEKWVRASVSLNTKKLAGWMQISFDDAVDWVDLVIEKVFNELEYQALVVPLRDWVRDFDSFVLAAVQKQGAPVVVQRYFVEKLHVFRKVGASRM